MMKNIELYTLCRWILWYCIFVKPQKINVCKYTHTGCDSSVMLMSIKDGLKKTEHEYPVLSGMTSAPRLLSPGTSSDVQATPTLCVSQSRSGSILLLLTDLAYRCSFVSSQLPAFERKGSPSSYSASQLRMEKIQFVTLSVNLNN